MIQKLRLFLFTNQTDGQIIVKNSTWLLVGKFGGRLLRTILVIYAARVLEVSDWGLFSYAISLVAIFSVITDLGISPLFVREVAKDNGLSKKEKIISTSFFLKIGLLIPAVILIIFFADTLPILNNPKITLGFFALILIFDSLRQLGFSIIKAGEKMEIQAGLHIFTNMVIMISGLYLLFISPSIRSLTYAYTLGAGMGTIITLFILRNYFKKILSGFDWKIAKEILSSAWPFATSSILGSIMISTDIFIIGLVLSSQEVGLYSVVDRVIQILYAPALILGTSIFPVFSRLANTNDEKIRQISKYLFRLIFIFLIPMVVVGIIFAPSIVKFVFGAKYLGAVLPLQILLPTLIIRFISIILVNTNFAYNKQRILVRFTILGVVSNIILDLLLIPIFGIVGSALATVLAQLMTGVYLWKNK